MPELLKLNLGCGRRLLSDYVNVDKYGDSDVRCDLETFPWPWETNSVGEVRLHHVLEHLGGTKAIYFGIVKELYRVCAPDAVLRIRAPHPRHDDFLQDPSHVRAITPQCFDHFSKRKNNEWACAGYANSPLGLYLDVDFEVVNVNLILDELWATQYSQQQIGQSEIEQAIRNYYNVVKEIHFEIKVVK